MYITENGIPSALVNLLIFSENNKNKILKTKLDI